MPNIIGLGQLSLVDLNDAIISGTAPANPSIGTLWIDESVSPKLLKEWDGTAWIVKGEIMNEGTGETISDIQETLGNMANDNLIDFNERQVVKDRLTEILGSILMDGGKTVVDNYLGKISGSTAEVPHIIRENQSTSILTPSQFTSEWTGYSLIEYLDGNTNSSIGSSSGRYGQQLFAINVIESIERKYGTIPDVDKVTWVKNNVSQFLVRWHGYGISPTGRKATLLVWDSVSSYVTIGSHTSTGISKIENDVSVNLVTYLGSDGFVYLNAHADASDGVTSSSLYSDYIEVEYVVGSVSNMPTVSELDQSGKGDFYTVRKSALNAGIPNTDTNYVTVGVNYNSLKEYLESLTPVYPWDTSLANKDSNISVQKSIFRDKWLQYYLAVQALSEATAQKLKDNVDNIEIGGTNYGRNGDFSIGLDKSSWTGFYVGGTKAIVDISTETPPFQFAYHVNNTTAMLGGIFTPTLFEGVIAESLVNKEIAVQFWLKYQNIVQGANSWNIGRFGELIVRGVKADLSYVYSYIKILDVIGGTDTEWRKHTGVIKIPLPSGADKIDLISFKHGLEHCTGEFWTTGIKIEIGNKVTDWSQSPYDLEGRLTDVEFKVLPESIVSTVTTSNTYVTDMQNINDQINTVSSTSASQLEIKSGEILSTVDTKISDSEGKLIKDYSSRISQTDERLMVEIGRATQAENDLGDSLQEVRTHFTFSDTGLGIGKSNSPLNISISNQQIDFVDNGSIVAYINGRKMYIDSLEVLNSIIIGNHQVEKYNDTITLIKYV